MTLAFTILAIIGIFIFIIAYSDDSEAMFLGAPMIIVFGVAAGLSYEENKDVEYKRSKSNKIDLPEEHQLISHNKLKPDTLLGYYRNDTLVIEFKH